MDQKNGLAALLAEHGVSLPLEAAPLEFEFPPRKIPWYSETYETCIEVEIRREDPPPVGSIPNKPGWTVEFLFVLEATGIVERDPHLIFELNGDEGYRKGLCSAPLAKDMGLTGFTADPKTNANPIDEAVACSIVERLCAGCHTPKRLGGVTE